MNYFTSRNLVLLALAQVVALIAAVLGASAAHKWHTSLRFLPGEPWSTRLLMGYGWLGLAIPVAWLVLTLCVMRSERTTDDVKIGVVLLGLLLLALFIAVACHGAAFPLFRMMGGDNMS